MRNLLVLIFERLREGLRGLLGKEDGSRVQRYRYDMILKSVEEWFTVEAEERLRRWIGVPTNSVLVTKVGTLEQNSLAGQSSPPHHDLLSDDRY